jgi:6-phosphogluconolactonase
VSQRQLHVFENTRELSLAAAKSFVTLAHQAIGLRGRFTVALAGGSTPRGLYELLAGTPYSEQIAWHDCEVFWGDERAVPPDHPESNYKLAQDSLLGHVPVSAECVHRMRGESANLERAASDYQLEIADRFGTSAAGPPPQFDLILLGMGQDGHTASLFPDTRAIEESERWVVANEVPQLKTHRLTMTFPLINEARKVFFLATGSSKAVVLSEILEGSPNPRRLPARSVRPKAGEIGWFLDRQAAARLQRPV